MVVSESANYPIRLTIGVRKLSRLTNYQEKNESQKIVGVCELSESEKYRSERIIIGGKLSWVCKLFDKFEYFKISNS